MCVLEKSNFCCSIYKKKIASSLVQMFYRDATYKKF